MSERVQAQTKNSATPSQATKPSSPQYQRPFTDERYESFGSNSNISKELEGIQPKTIRRSLNWQNITVEAPSRSDGMSLPGGIQRQQEQPGAVIGHQVAVDSEEKSAEELSNSTISTDGEAPQPKIDRARLDWRKIPVEAPTHSGGYVSPQPIQRQEEEQEQQDIQMKQDATIQRQETADSEEESAINLPAPNNYSSSNDGSVQQPKIALGGFNLANMSIFPPAKSVASTPESGGIQRQQAEEEKEQEDETNLQMKPDGAIQLKCSKCETEEKQDNINLKPEAETQEHQDTTGEDELSDETVQRQAEDNDELSDEIVQRQAEDSDELSDETVQRQAEDSDELSDETVQRQAEDSDELSDETVQRQAEDSDELSDETVQRQSEDSDELSDETVQRQAEDSDELSGEAEEAEEGELSPEASTVQRRATSAVVPKAKVNLKPSGAGSLLPKPVQQKMSAAFNTNFSDVRIHEGSQAKSIQALAYTQGNNIHFAPGKYNPTSEEGQKLLGHELTHVVQQRAGRVPVPQGKGTPINADPALEAEADDLGAKAAQGKSVTVAGASSGVQRQSAQTTPIQRFKLFSKIANTVKNNVSSAVNTVKSGVNTVKNTAQRGVNTVKNKVSSGVSAVKNKVSSGVNRVKRGFNTVRNKVSSGVNRVKRGFNTVKNKVSSGVNRVKRGLNTVKNQAKRAYNTVKNKVASNFKAVKRGVNLVKNQAKRAYNAAKNQVKRGFNTVKNKVGGNLNIAKRGFNAVKNGIKGNFNAVKNKVSSGFNTAKQSFNAAKNGVKSAYNTVKNKVSSGFNTVKNGLKNVNWGDVGHAALDIAGFIPVVGAVADVANAAWYLAEGDYANAALSGISAIPGIGDAIGGVAKGGKAALKLAKGSNILGKANKLLPNAGKLVGKAGGLANKVSSGAGKLVGKVGGLANKVPPGVKSAFNKGMSGFNKVMNVADKVGTGVDVATTAHYLAQGDYGNALVSGISAIPGVGKGGKGLFNRAKGSKLFNKAGKGVGKVGGLANKVPGGIKSIVSKGKGGLSAAKNKLDRGVSGLNDKLRRGKGKPNAGTAVPNKVSGTKTPGGAKPSGKGKPNAGTTVPNKVSGTKTPGGVKPKRDLPMTTKEQGVLNNTASKRGNELTPKELNAEREVARRAERKPSNDGEHVEQIDLPNGHELKKRKDGTWCRFSDKGKCGKEFDPDLANRGYRPKPGERSMTREQSKEQRRQSRIRRRMQRLEAEGHGPARHGSQLTEQQLVDRAKLGHDPVTGTTNDAYNKFPDGTPKPHKYGRHATKVRRSGYVNYGMTSTAMNRYHRDAINLSPGQSKMATGANIGKDPTPDTIREGSVRMEQHPQYEETIRQVKAGGFEIKSSNEARVEIKEVVDSNGNIIRVEKLLYVKENMRYLDLEHELGHIKQLERFGENIPPTVRVMERPDGSLKNAPNQQGVLTTWQNTITEYHNRLDEFVRLYERGASPELLKEHAQGVEFWLQAYRKKGLKEGRSPTQKAWADKYFPDIAQMQARYFELVKTIN